MYTVGGCADKRRDMRDSIEDLIYEILLNNNPEDSARVLSGVIYDVQDGNDIEYSIYTNCEIILGE